jgi:hypothetical protein
MSMLCEFFDEIMQLWKVYLTGEVKSAAKIDNPGAFLMIQASLSMRRCPQQRWKQEE